MKTASFLILAPIMAFAQTGTPVDAGINAVVTVPEVKPEVVAPAPKKAPEAPALADHTVIGGRIDPKYVCVKGKLYADNCDWEIRRAIERGTIKSAVQLVRGEECRWYFPNGRVVSCG